MPFDAHDLPGYAVDLYDSYLTAPELVRLTSWNRLERVPAGDILAGQTELAQPKLDPVAEAQREGRIVDGIHPGDVYSLVIALAGTWSPVSLTSTASAADDAADHERRRAALRLAVQRALVP